MKPPYESLSRLLSGDLTEDEAERVRRLIEEDPEVRAAWEEIQATVDDVAGLHDPPVPSHLDARVLGLAPASARRPRRTVVPLAVATLLAAAATVALLVRPGAPTITLLEGAHVVDGRADVLAAGVPIAIDGTAQITVDPPVVSVSVTRGRARLTGPAGVTTIAQGETHTFGEPATGAIAENRTLLQHPTSRIAALESQVEELRRALAEAEFTGAVTRGQLTASQGAPAEWPEGLPEAYRPAAFERNLHATLSDLPGAEVHALDCSEYPCIATLRIAHPSEGWEKQVEAYVEKLTTSHYPASDSWVAIAKSDADGAVVGGVGLAVTPEYQLTEELRTRTQFRVTSLLGEIEHTPPEP